jgi:RNA polymerase primary sigma factor
MSPVEVDRPLDEAEREALAAEARRGARAERDLAGWLERPLPPARDIGPHHLKWLADRTAAPGGLDPELIWAAKAGDERAVARVVEAHLPLIAAVARRYERLRHVGRLELIQEGVAGLMDALHRYDPAAGTPLWTYALPAVQRAMQRLATELGDAVTLSHGALRRLSRLRSAEDDLMRERRRLPSRKEIIERAGVDRRDAEEVLAATMPPRSFEEPITAADGGVIGSFGDLVDDPRTQDACDRALDAIEAEELLPLLSVLSARERHILAARYGLDGEPQSRRQIAERLGLSVSRVRDIEQRALAKLSRAAATVGAMR